ncbi:MAG: hypothetical protein MUP70_17180, partial [Candidatus Aminicenantes bacterium]|nr:hypothetical protein [Candidatus Aminicenantes bacterium]
SRMDALGLVTSYVGPGTLFDRLEPQRIRRTEMAVREPASLLNLDRRPIGYYLHSILWAKQFRGPEHLFLQSLRKAPLSFYIGLFILGMSAAGFYLLIAKKRTGLYLLPIAGMGLSTIVLEMILLLAYQVRLGELYSGLSLLFTCFMAGLYMGSLTAGRRKTATLSRLTTLQAGITLLCGTTALFLDSFQNAWSFCGLLLLLGFLNGCLFVEANRLYLLRGQNTGLGYGIDILGSFFGTLVSAAILFPLLGQTGVLLSLLVLNGFNLLFLAAAGLRT